MAVPVSLRNMPDHIWSKKDEAVESKNWPKYDIVQFPQTNTVLWDSSPQGSAVQLNVANYRKPFVCVSEKLLRLLQRQCENQPQQSLSTILLGSLAIDNDGEGVMFHIDRLDTRTNADNSLNLAPEDVTIPFQVYINGSKERGANVMEFTDTLKSLEARCYSKEVIELGGFMLTRGWCNFYTGAEHCVAHIDLNLVTLSTQFNAIPLSPIPIVPTALSKNLAGPLSFSHVQGIPKTGYLTMDHTRKLLLVLESDPKALSLPVVGIWISGAPVVHHPFVWCACLRYIHNAHLQDRVFSPPDNFLVVLYSPLHSKPEFYECATNNGKSDLDFDLYTGYDACNITKNSRSTNCGVIKIDLNCMKVGPKSEVFDAALNVFRKKRCMPSEVKSSCKVNGVDDMEPRLTPAPLVARTPMIQNLVPDISFVVDDLPSANHSRSKVKQQPNTTTNNDNTKLSWSAGYKPPTSDYSGDVTATRTKSINSVRKQSVTSLPPQALVKNNSSNQASPGQIYQPAFNNYQPTIPTPNIISRNCDVKTKCQNNDSLPMNDGLAYSQPYKQQNPMYQTRQSNGHSQQYLSNYSNRCSVPVQRQCIMIPSAEIHLQQSPLLPQTASHKFTSLQSQGPADIQQIHETNNFFTSQTVCNNLPVYTKHNSAFHHIMNQGMNTNFRQLPQQPPLPLQNSNNINSCRPTLENDITEQSRQSYLANNSQNNAQADSTCSGKSSDDSGLSVTPDRSNPSPKECSPTEKAMNYSEPFPSASLNKEQCSPEVYNLLMQQNAQLQQLQTQIQLLLQKQHESKTSPNSTEMSTASVSADNSNSAMKSISEEEAPEIYIHMNSKKIMDEVLDKMSQNDSIPLNSDSVQALNTDVNNETQPTHSDTKRDESENYSSGHTPIEIRHKGVVALNSTQREDSENMEHQHEDLITVLSNIGLHDQIASSCMDESSPRSNDVCDNIKNCSQRNGYISSYESPTQLSNESRSFGPDQGSENPQYYENLIANIRQFLDSHEDTTKEDMKLSEQRSKCISDKLVDNSSLETFLKCAQSDQCVDTTIIPKISYMSMMFDSDSDTSVEINAMAMKYLKDEQLTQLMKLQNNALLIDKNGRRNTLLRQLLHSEHNGMRDTSQNGFSVNDMTFATRTYMEKHGLLENSASVPDKSFDFEFQMKTDYSISSNEVSSPIRTFTNPQIDIKNPEDAYARIRLLKSPVKKEILPTENVFSPQMYDTRCKRHSVSSSITAKYLKSTDSSSECNGGSLCHQVLNKGYMKHSYNPYSTDPSINQDVDDDDERILDIVKLKQMPKLL